MSKIINVRILSMKKMSEVRHWSTKVGAFHLNTFVNILEKKDIISLEEIVF